MSGQLGYAPETVAWGTSATPTKFLPVTQAQPSYVRNPIMSQAIRAGQLAEDRGKPGFIDAGGSVTVELHNLDIARLLRHLFGAVVTSGAGPYTHTYNLAVPTQGLTIQTGSEQTGGTVTPFTAVGSMVHQWNLSATVSDPVAKLSMDFTAKDIRTDVALATASYADSEPFTAVEASITVDGSPFTTANSFTLTVPKQLKTDRWFLGSPYRNIQRNVSKWPMTVEFSAEFESAAMFQHVVDADDVALVVLWDNGTDSLEITANMQIVGNPAGLTTQGIEPQTVRGRICRPVGGDDADAITAVLINAESSAA